LIVLPFFLGKGIVMLRRRLIAGFLALLCGASLPVRGEAAQGLERAKKATALVRISVDGKRVGYGTAFCIDDAGYFVTNAHVADGRRGVELILEPGEKSQRVASALVLRTDKTLDLALLQVTQGGPFTALPLGKIEGLMETMDIVAFGYPFGGEMALDKDDFPAISVNKGRITSLRKKGGELEYIQVDAALNPGNSGGPVLNGAGEVIGIVKSGIVGSGVNFAIPVNHLGKLLKEPLVSVAAATLEYARRSEPQQITVKLVSLERPIPDYAVELTLKAGEGAARVLKAQTHEGACRFNVSLADAPAKDADVLIVTGTFADGAITGRVTDRAMQIGGQKVKLSEIREVQFNAQGVGSFAVGERTLTGSGRDLEGVAISLAGTSLTPNWSKAQKIVIANAVEPVRSVEYTVKATAKEKNITPINGAFVLTGAPETGGMAMTLWPMIRSGLAEHRTTESAAPGGGFSMREPYTDIPAEGGVLVGFKLAMGKFINTPTIEGLQPIYMTEKGEKLGAMLGKDTGTPARVQAKKGYVITKIRVRAGGNLDGIGLTLTRMVGMKLMTNDTYESEWVGARQGGGETTIETKGGLAVGISGKKAEKIGSLAMVILPLDGGGAVARAEGTGPTARVEGRDPAARIELPEAGKPYTSVEQLFETLPNELQPAGGHWAVGTAVSPELTGRVKDQLLLMTLEFASVKTNEKDLEVTLDLGPIDWRGFHMTGQVLAKFPLDQAERFKKMRIHDKVTIQGKIQGVVVRGRTPQGMVINKTFIWLEDCQVK
jgi:hypothetical protein